MERGRAARARALGALGGAPEEAAREEEVVRQLQAMRLHRVAGAIVEVGDLAVEEVRYPPRGGHREDREVAARRGSLRPLRLLARAGQRQVRKLLREA